MVKKIIRIYINSFKYSRRLARLCKTLDVLIKEFDLSNSLEDKALLHKSIVELHRYTSELLNEFKSYIEDNKLKGVK